MAQFHMNMKYISRAGGKSITAHAAHISGTCLQEDRTGLVFDYTKRQGLIISGIRAPEGTPEWLLDRQALWNHVENFEDFIAETRFRGHKDPIKNAKSMTAKEKYLETCKTSYQATVGLPIEIERLDHLEELAIRIIDECYVKEGLIVDYGLHPEESNPHLHIASTTRPLKGETFSRTRFVIEKEKVVEIRLDVADIINEFAKEKGYNFSVDARSYKDRGIDIEASRHLGPKAFHKYKEKSQIGDENEEVRLKNIELLLQKPHEIVKLVASQKPVFTREDIEREIFKRVGGDMNLFSLLKMKVEAGLEKDFGQELQFDAQVIQEHWRMMKAPEASNANTASNKSSIHWGDNASAAISEDSHMAAKSFGFFENVSLFVQRAFSRFLDQVHVNTNTNTNTHANTSVTNEAQEPIPVTSSELIQNLLEKANANREPLTPESLQDHEALVKRFTHDLLQSAGVALGQNLRGQEIFTTKEVVELEEHTKAVTQRLKAGTGKVISRDLQEAAIAKVEAQEKLSYSEEQRGAIAHLLDEKQIQILTGKAGTGKTTVLKPVVEAYKEAGYIPIGVAFQGKVSELLSTELGIPSFTLDQLLHHWKEREALIKKLPELQGKALEKAELQIEKKSQYLFTDKHVVILDEGNMVGGNLWKGLLDNVESSGAHLRVVQDQNQIKALYGLDISRLVEQEVGAYEIKEVFRQKTPWMRECSALLNDHKVEAGLTPYAEKGHFTFRDTVDSAKYAIVEAYIHDVQSRLDGESDRSEELENHLGKNTPSHLLQDAPMVLAFKKEDVQEINEGVRTQLKALGHLKVHSAVYEGKDYALGERVFFAQNDHTEFFIKVLEGEKGRGIKNGTLGIIEAIDPNQQFLSVRLSDGRLIGVDLKTYDALEYGYATTVNKAEGETYDRVLGFFDPLMDASKTLVWASRHKTDFRAFVSKTHGETIPELAAHVERAEYRPLLGDFNVTPENEAAVRLMRNYVSASKDASQLWTTILKESQEEPFLHEAWSDFKAAQAERNTYAKEMLKEWNQCAGFVRQLGLKRSTLEIQAGLKDRILTTPEKDALARVEAYRVLAAKARDLHEEKSSLTGDVKHTQEELTHVTALRDAMAYEIATFPELHKPFFKVSQAEDVFLSYAGETYNRRPASWKNCERHAQSYMNDQRNRFYIKTLNKSEKAAYQELLEYKAHSHECARLVSLLKPESQRVKETNSHKETSEKLSDLKAQLNSVTQERDFLAYKIVTNYERYRPHFEKAGIPEDKILTHAVSGELRQSLLKYQRAQTVEERLDAAHIIQGFIRSEGAQDAINKKAYALTKEIGLDPQRIQFEAGAFAHPHQTNEVLYKSLDELQKAYVDLKAHRKTQRIGQDGNTASQAHPRRDSIIRLDQPNNPYLKAEEVEAALTQDMMRFTDHIFSSLGIQHHRGSSSATERRFGKNGHIAVNLKTGAWIDHKDSSLTGGPLSLLTKLKGMDYRETIEYGAAWAGLTGETRTLAQSIKPVHAPAANTDLSEYQERIQKAKDLWEKALPIEGTVAERYLRDHRKIYAKLPLDLRYLPPQRQQGETSNQSPAGLVVAARNSKGEIQAVQVTYLDPTTAQKADIEVKKRSFGVLKGSAVTLQEDKDHSNTNTLYVAEGVETALSLKAAGVKGTILASLGLSNIKRLSPAPGTKIIVCADHDAPDSPALKTLHNAIAQLKDQGHDVHVIKPQTQCHDFNDVLKLHGIEGVRSELQQQLPEDIRARAFKDTQSLPSSLEERFELTPEQSKNLNYKVSKGIALTDEEKDLIRQLEIQHEKDQQKLRATESHSSAPEPRFELTPEQTKTLNYKVSKGLSLTDAEKGLIKKLEEQYEKDQKNNMKTTANSHSMANTRFELTPEQTKTINYKVSKGIPLTDEEKELVQKLEAQYKADLKQSQRMAILDRDRIDMHNTHEHHHEDLSQQMTEETTRKRGRSISR